MRFIKQIYKDTDNELEHWKEILGGEIEGNTLSTQHGTIKEYKFSTHRIIVVRLQLSEETITNRIVNKPLIYYPIIFSDSITFEPVENGITQATPSKSISTGIYFSDKDTLFRYPKGYDFNMILFRIPKQAFEYLLPKDNLFLKHLQTGESYHFYESISLDMKVLMQQIYNSDYPSILEHEMAGVHSWKLFLLFVEKFFYQRNNNYQSINKEVQQTLHKVKEFMLSDLSNPKSIEELVKFSGMSATKLRSSFKEVYGMSIYTLFQEHRMERACELLKQGNMSVSEVAYDLGYTHLGHFTETFKKKYHCLPKNLKSI